MDGLDIVLRNVLANELLLSSWEVLKRDESPAGWWRVGAGVCRAAICRCSGVEACFTPLTNFCAVLLLTAILWRKMAARAGWDKVFCQRKVGKTNDYKST